MPVYRPRREWIEAAVESVQQQSYENWQLCVCCDGPAEPWLDDWLRRRVAENPRIKVAFPAERCGIASTLNGAGTLANGDYLAFLDQDDVLPATALHFIVEALQYDQADVLYSDEDWMHEAGSERGQTSSRTGRPSCCRPACTSGTSSLRSASSIAKVGWFRDGFEGAQDYDLALRLVGEGASVRHVPRVLYHWRMHEGSTAASAGAKPHAQLPGSRALEQALHANGVKVPVVRWPRAAYLRRAMGTRHRRRHHRDLLPHADAIGAMP